MSSVESDEPNDKPDQSIIRKLTEDEQTAFREAIDKKKIAIVGHSSQQFDSTTPPRKRRRKTISQPPNPVPGTPN